jgi:hypothetical protein
VTTEYYQTSISLIAGSIYKFKVTATNSVGISLESSELPILVAKLPDAPLNLANVPEVTTGYQVGLTWTDGVYDGSSPVIDYQVSFTEVSVNTYAIFASGITT